jgi:hypothetical protein
MTTEHPEYHVADYTTPRESTPRESPPNLMTREWRLVLEAVSETLAEMRANLRAEFKIELEREVLKLRAEFLQCQLDEARGTKRLKAVPSGPASLIA